MFGTTGSQRGARCLRTLAAGLLLVVDCYCGSVKTGTDAGGVPSPEERFGNDRALVTAFAELKSCWVEGGRIDYSCVPLETLRDRLERGHSDPGRRGKLTVTLLNLLESQSELSRLVAAENLYHERGDPRVEPALWAALQRDSSAAVKAVLLRVLCWSTQDKQTSRAGADVQRTALAILRTPGPESLRLEATSCLGRGRPTAEVVALLRELLPRERSSALRGALCTTLGELGADTAVPEIGTQLNGLEADGRCAAALAAVGGESAYGALKRSVATGLERGRVSVQVIAALLAFADRPFFERASVVEQLSRLGNERRLSWVTRQRAVAELSRLNARPELLSLRACYRRIETASAGEQLVRDEIERALSK